MGKIMRAELGIRKGLSFAPKILRQMGKPFFKIAVKRLFIGVVRLKIARKLKIVRIGERIGQVVQQNTETKGVERRGLILLCGKLFCHATDFGFKIGMIVTAKLGRVFVL